MFLFYVRSFFKKGDTIQGGTLIKGGLYFRKYGKWPLLDLAKDHEYWFTWNEYSSFFKMQNSHLLKRFNHSLKSISLSFYILDVRRFIQGFERKKKTLYFQDYRKEKDIDFKTSTQKAVGIFALIVHLLKNAISNNKFNKTILKMH